MQTGVVDEKSAQFKVEKILKINYDMSIKSHNPRFIVEKILKPNFLMKIHLD